MKARHEAEYEDAPGPFPDSLSSKYIIPFVKRNPDKTGVNGISALVSFYESYLRTRGVPVRSIESRDAAEGMHTTLHMDFRPERKNGATVSVDDSKRESAITIVGIDNYDIIKIATQEFLEE